VLDKPIKIRKTWLINPATRVKKSKKIYSRQKIKEETRKRIKDEKK
jgi:hypothetical protein